MLEIFQMSTPSPESLEQKEFKARNEGPYATLLLPVRAVPERVRSVRPLRCSDWRLVSTWRIVHNYADVQPAEAGFLTVTTVCGSSKVGGLRNRGPQFHADFLQHALLTCSY